MIDAGHHVAIFRFVPVQLDRQPKLVHRIGVAHRFFVTDQAGLVQVEQGLIEGLHAQL